MVSMTVAVADELKLRIERFSWVNWSELSREEILRRVERDEALAKLDELTKNSKLTDKDCLELGKLIKESMWKSYKEAS